MVAVQKLSLVKTRVCAIIHGFVLDDELAHLPHTLGIPNWITKIAWINFNHQALFSV